MKILSFDMGIHHLSYCVYDTVVHEIEQWEVVDILSSNHIHQHRPDLYEGYLYSTLQRFTKIQLVEIITFLSVDHRFPSLETQCKSTLQQCLRQYWVDKKVKKVLSTDIEFLSYQLFYFLQKTFDDIIYRGIDLIIIENQPCMKNPTMKSLQMMLYSFFMIEKCKNLEESAVDIRFVSANKKSKKLQDICNKKKGFTYKEKKQLSILYVTLFLQQHPVLSSWLSFFQKHSKKDDLADCLIQIDDVLLSTSENE